MLALKAKCPVCGTTVGPWWASRDDGLICVSCYGWVHGFYQLLEAYGALLHAYARKRLPSSYFWNVARVFLTPWGFCPLHGHSRMVN